MKLYALGHVAWLDSQLLYHTLAKLDREGLFVLSSREPYVCIGAQQDLDQEADTAYCEAEDIAVFRRELEGGALYVDGRQVLYQLVLRGDNPLLLPDEEALYQKLLTSVARTYRDLGIPAECQSENDVVVAGRKISSNEMGEIDGSFVMAGNLILDLDRAAMSQALKGSVDSFASIVRELGWLPPMADLLSLLRANFEDVLGPLKLADVGSELRAEADKLKPRFTSERWLRVGQK